VLFISEDKMNVKKYKYNGRKVVLLEDSPTQAKISLSKITPLASHDHYENESEFITSMSEAYQRVLLDGALWPDVFVLDLEVPPFDEADDSKNAGVRCFHSIRSYELLLNREHSPVIFYSSQNKDNFFDRMKLWGYDEGKHNFYFFEKPNQAILMSQTLDDFLRVA